MSADGSQQHVGITSCGKVFTWGKSNEMGQLGRKTISRKDCRIPAQVAIPSRAIRGFAGGSNESGHTVVLDSDGYLWMAGCDRWQQLGLGSAEGGASGYTWENGMIWRDFFTRNDFIKDLLASKDESIRDVARRRPYPCVVVQQAGRLRFRQRWRRSTRSCFEAVRFCMGAIN
ncbi:hypothetical protein MHU86_8951 [Fragilaria crotonensis]|nr:hypothetical protein MHU86_8951 [Fragilaria crotonensis]